MEIPLTNGYYALVDEVDYEALRAIGPWCFSPSGYSVHYGRDGLGNRRTVYMHRIVMDRILGHPVGSLTVDHISSIEMGKAARLDNRRENLRLATRSQQQAHKGRARNNSSLFKGVTATATVTGLTWEARIRYKDKRIHLGHYGSPVTAAQMYDAASKRLYKEFAGLNFPEEITPTHMDDKLDSILARYGV